MDPLTHGLAAGLVAYALGVPELIPFVVAGSMIVDADVLLSLVGDRDPRRYLLTHGGIAHSLAGAAVMGVLAWTVVAPAAGAGLFPPPLSGAAPLAALAAALLGAYLHVGLDWLACPGLPLLAPASDRKFTLGLLPGPSLLLFGATSALLAGVALGADAFSALVPYGVAVAGFVAIRLAAFALVRAGAPGAARYVPAARPLRWLLIDETPDAWSVGTYLVGRGTTGTATFPKYRGTTPAAVAPCLDLPEVRRVRYHSYITTATGEGGALVVADPLRQSGTVRYPPYFTEVRVPRGACRAGR